MKILDHSGQDYEIIDYMKAPPSPEELNSVMKEESENDFNQLIGYTNDPIVSSDVIGREETMVFDAKATMVTADRLLKTLCWYDNGWGFSKRILDTIRLYHGDKK